MDIKKFWPTLIPVLGLLIDQFSGTISTFLSAHATISLLLVTVVTALANAVKPSTK